MAIESIILLEVSACKSFGIVLGLYSNFASWAYLSLHNLSIYWIFIYFWNSMSYCQALKYSKGLSCMLSRTQIYNNFISLNKPHFLSEYSYNPLKGSHISLNKSKTKNHGWTVSRPTYWFTNLFLSIFYSHFSLFKSDQIWSLSLSPKLTWSSIRVDLPVVLQRCRSSPRSSRYRSTSTCFLCRSSLEFVDGFVLIFTRIYWWVCAGLHLSLLIGLHQFSLGFAFSANQQIMLVLFQFFLKSLNRS